MDSIIENILSKNDIAVIYRRYQPYLNSVFSEIKKYFPDLRNSANLTLSTNVNISKIKNDINIEPPTNEKGSFNCITNTIEIHPWCVEQYIRGNGDILYRVLIHEMIHACGEKSEEITIQKTERYFSNLKNKRGLKTKNG